MGDDHEDLALDEYERALVEATIVYDAKDGKTHPRELLHLTECVRCSVVRHLSKGSQRLIENARATKFARAAHVEDTTCGKLLFITRQGTSPTCVLPAGHEGGCSSTKGG